MFDDLIAGVNRACLNSFGKSYPFTRVNSSPSGETGEITGILDTGVELENQAPLEGSTYAVLWVQSADINPPLANGDEIASDQYVYAVIRVRFDAGQGISYELRQDRLVS
jgi:hypothetical protein